MEARLRRSEDAPPHPGSSEVGFAAPTSDLQCRVCELEEENARLRLLVSELLVKNQRLRD